MHKTKSPLIVKFLTRHFLNWEIKTNKKVIYITFDDGPIPEVTPKVIKILAQYKAKATFFCVGENALKYPEVLKMLKDDNHVIGNHTYNHLNGWKNNAKYYSDNISKAQDVLDSPFFRPPYGKINLKALINLKKKYKIIMWSVLTGDYNQKVSSEDCLHNALRFTKGGSIVVFHDSIKASKHLFYVLPKFLQFFSEKGFTFEVLNSDICV